MGGGGRRRGRGALIDIGVCKCYSMLVFFFYFGGGVYRKIRYLLYVGLGIGKRKDWGMGLSPSSLLFGNDDT